MEAKTLRDKAVLVKFTGHGWGAHKIDHAAQERVAKLYGAKHSRVGWYRKYLLPKEVIAQWWQVVGAARATHHQNSLPWMDGSVRMVPVTNLQHYEAEMKKHIREGDKVKADIVGNYEKYQREGMLLLGKMANKADYPTKERIAAMFDLEIRVTPVPDLADWRIDYPAKEMAKLRKQAQDTLSEIQREAIAELWERLHDVVRHAVETLSDKDKTFRNSLFENLKKVTTLLTKLNLTSDKHLEALRKEVEAKLAKQTPDEVRASAGHRSKLAGEAKAILKKMESYMGTSAKVSK